MTGKELAQKVRMERWAQEMRARNESGESVRAWYASNGINEKTFYYWQRKLRQAARGQITEQERSLQKTGLIPAGWAQVETKEPTEETLTILIGSITIQATQKTDMDLLVKVCRALVPPC